MKRTSVIVLLCFVLSVFVINRTVIRAQDAGGEERSAVSEEAEAGGEKAAAPRKTEGVSVLKLVLKHSGWPGWIIILLSIVAFYMIIRLVRDLRMDSFVPKELADSLEEHVRNLQLAEAVAKCRDNRSVLARVVGSGLLELEAGYDKMADIMEERADEEATRFNQRVHWLSVIAAVTPMLGLTGTVLGMMGAFGTISQMEGQPPPKLLAGDIQTALVTTCEGLIVAVPLLIAYAIFRNRVTTLMLEVGVAGAGVVGSLKNVEITPSMTAGLREAAAEPEEAAPPPPPPPPAEESEGPEESDAPTEGEQ